MSRRLAPCLLAVFLVGNVTLGQQDSPEENTAQENAPQENAPQENADEENPAHAELRELRDSLLKDVDEADIDGMLGGLHPDVVVTFMDGTQCNGPDEVRAYFKKMLEGADGNPPIVKSFHTDVEVAELTTLYGDDTGVAHGDVTSTFDLTDGSNFTVNGFWTATVVKQDGKWKIASLHSSASLFDNPLLELATGWITKAAVLAGLGGLLLGGVVMAFIKKK